MNAINVFKQHDVWINQKLQLLCEAFCIYLPNTFEDITENEHIAHFFVFN